MLQWGENQAECDSYIVENYRKEKARDIAAKLGAKSKSAIIARARRLGLQIDRDGKRVPARGTSPPRKRNLKLRDRKRRPDWAIPFATKKREMPSFPRPTEGGPAPLNLTLMQIERGQCRYIAGDDHLFCGHVTVEDKSYCAFHMKLCYAPPRPR